MGLGKWQVLHSLMLVWELIVGFLDNLINGTHRQAEILEFDMVLYSNSWASQLCILAGQIFGNRNTLNFCHVIIQCINKLAFKYNFHFCAVVVVEVVMVAVMVVSVCVSFSFLSSSLRCSLPNWAMFSMLLLKPAIIDFPWCADKIISFWKILANYFCQVCERWIQEAFMTKMELEPERWAYESPYRKHGWAGSQVFLESLPGNALAYSSKPLGQEVSFSLSLCPSHSPFLFWLRSILPLRLRCYMSVSGIQSPFWFSPLCLSSAHFYYHIFWIVFS